MAGGRPARLNLNDAKTLKRVRDMAAHGMMEKDIARCIGVTAPYFSELKKSNPQLVEAIKAGQAEGLDKITAALFEKATSKDLGAMIFYLKCKGGWRENEPQLDRADGDTAATGKRLLDRIRGMHRG